MNKWNEASDKGDKVARYDHIFENFLSGISVLFSCPLGISELFAPIWKVLESWLTAKRAYSCKL